MRWNPTIWCSLLPLNTREYCRRKTSDVRKHSAECWSFHLVECTNIHGRIVCLYGVIRWTRDGIMSEMFNKSWDIHFREIVLLAIPFSCIFPFHFDFPIRNENSVLTRREKFLSFLRFPEWNYTNLLNNSEFLMMERRWCFCSSLFSTSFVHEDSQYNINTMIYLTNFSHLFSFNLHFSA